MVSLLMAHSDDHGLVLPPKLAPYQVVIVPIYKGEEQYKAVKEAGNKIREELRDFGISVKFDDRDTYKPGWKFNEYELKGVPVRIAIGPKDLEKGTVEVARRDTLEKEFLQQTDVANKVEHLLEQIQINLLTKSQTFAEENTRVVDSWEEFKDTLENKPGFIYAHWDGTNETEERIKSETKATIRCIPKDAVLEDGVCVFSGSKSIRKVLFAKAY